MERARGVHIIYGWGGYKYNPDFLSPSISNSQTLDMKREELLIRPDFLYPPIVS